MTDTSPNARGTYLLLIQLDQDAELTIGRLGTFAFHAGWYAYAGSALGPGGLTARLARHARTTKPRHWHVDHLLARARLVQSWQAACSDRLECRWAAAIGLLPNAQIVPHRFGASDCRCPGHLVYWPSRPDDLQIEQALRSTSPHDCILQSSLYEPHLLSHSFHQPRNV